MTFVYREKESCWQPGFSWVVKVWFIPPERLFTQDSRFRHAKISSFTLKIMLESVHQNKKNPQNLFVHIIQYIK